MFYLHVLHSCSSRTHRLHLLVLLLQRELTRVVDKV